MSVILATLHAKPGHELEVEEALNILVERTGTESGVLEYVVHRDGAEFVVYERYADDSARDAHFAAPYLAEALAALEGALAEPPQVRRLRDIASVRGREPAAPRASQEDARGDRYARGLRRLREIDGEAGERVVQALDEIAPAVGRYIVEFAFGDIYSRPGLDLKSRELATIAALAALGTARPQLRVHVEAALNVGWTRTEIVETMLHVALYAGFPATLNAVDVVREVLADREVPRAPSSQSACE